jgi:transcription antitermination factor NusG
MLHQKGFEEFLPLYRRYRRWSDRTKPVDLPLFPGYVFCLIDPRDRLGVLTIPGALHFVAIGNVPAPIDPGEIAAIQAAVGSGLSTEPWEYLAPDQLVRLEWGPLAGLEGTLLDTSKGCRIIVSVNLLNRSIAIEIERRWVTPIGEDGRPLGVGCWFNDRGPKYAAVGDVNGRSSSFGQ